MATANINGIEIFYELKGNPDAKETVMFLNGVMASTSSWAFQVPVFEKLGFRVLLHDFRGQLKSEKPEGKYSFEQHANDTITLMDHLGIDKAHFIGTSYGGEVSMQCAISYPDRVKSISIIDSVSELDGMLRCFIDGWMRLAADYDGEKFFWGMAPTIYQNDFIESNYEMLCQRAKATGNTSKDYFDGQISLYKTFLTLDLTKDLHKIKCPALIVCGEGDILKPVKFSQIIVDNIPQAEYAVIPNCGHVTIFERPDVLNSLLAGFIIKQ